MIEEPISKICDLKKKYIFETVTTSGGGILSYKLLNMIFQKAIYELGERGLYVQLFIRMRIIKNEVK